MYTPQENKGNKFGPPYVVINLSKIGLRYFRIGINSSPGSKERLLAHFVSHPNIGWVFLAEGYFNLAVGIWAKDNAEINDISQQVRGVLSPEDEIVFQSELTSLYGFGSRPISDPVAPMSIVDATAHPIILSPLEIDYIKLLALDSSMTEGELATLLNVDTSRIIELKSTLAKNGVIVGFQDRVEYSGIYYKIFIDTLSRKTKNAEEDLIKDLWKDDKCIYIERANSKYDLEFEVILGREKELEKYLQNFSDYKVAMMKKNIYTNLYPVNKVANVKEIKEALLSQTGEIVDLRNSKLWYLNYAGAEAYLDIYKGNKKYFEVMEKSELDLFEEIATYVKDNYEERIFSVLDIGSGDGLKGRVFIEKLGEQFVKAYYPIDIQPVELAAALTEHADGKYAKHPTLLDIENMSTRFPLKVNPGEKQIYVFLGGTYGNFMRERINNYLKPIVGGSSFLFIAIPIVSEGKTDEEIESYYVSEMVDNMILGPLSQLGFKRRDFKENEKYDGIITHHEMFNRSLITSLILKNDVTIFGRLFKAGTRFRFTTSWKPTLEEFRKALEKDFIIEKMFNNKDMAIAMIKSVLH